jgi:hypothetical protein
MHVVKKIASFWQDRSLRFWLGTGMLMTLCPIFFAAVAGHFLYHEAIIQPLVEICSQQRKILQPLQSLRMTLDDTSEAVVDYSVDGESRHADEYRQLSGKIEADLANLITAIDGHDFEVSDMNRAKAEWQDVATTSLAILSGELKHNTHSNLM